MLVRVEWEEAADGKRIITMTEVGVGINKSQRKLET
jgi:hypothetical protein